MSEQNATSRRRATGRSRSTGWQPSNVPDGALDTVGGKQVLSPIQGFGKMWQKTYSRVARGRRRDAAAR